MRITILTTGSLGDIVPFLALAVGLQDAGHIVRLAVPPNYQGLVESYGVKFSALGQDNKKLLLETKVQDMIESGVFFSFVVYRVREKLRKFNQINLQALQACQDAELIIYRINEYIAAFSIAQKKSIPCIEVALIPLIRTKTFPSLWFTGSPNLGGAYNWITHFLTEQMLWQIFRHSTNQFRNSVLGLGPLPFTGSEKIKRGYGVPILNAFSPTLVTKPIDWPDWAHITGYWILNDSKEWKPPESLHKFIESGPTPIYIGFGSMPSRNPQDTHDLLIKAFQLSGQRAVIATGWGGISSHSNADEQYYFLENAPHEWLFPRMSAVIHHGGVGTTAAGIRAGVPTIIIPHSYDQPFWGNMVTKLGIGPPPIPRNKLSSEKLAHAINLAISDQNMRRKADLVGKKVREEDGVGYATELINKFT